MCELSWIALVKRRKERVSLLADKDCESVEEKLILLQRFSSHLEAVVWLGTEFFKVLDCSGLCHCSEVWRVGVIWVNFRVSEDDASGEFREVEEDSDEQVDGSGVWG